MRTNRKIEKLTASALPTRSTWGENEGRGRKHRLHWQVFLNGRGNRRCGAGAGGAGNGGTNPTNSATTGSATGVNSNMNGPGNNNTAPNGSPSTPFLARRQGGDKPD
jgi:hypothetical protein